MSVVNFLRRDYEKLKSQAVMCIKAYLPSMTKPVNVPPKVLPLLPLEGDVVIDYPCITNNVSTFTLYSLPIETLVVLAEELEKLTKNGNKSS